MGQNPGDESVVDATGSFVGAGGGMGAERPSQCLSSLRVSPLRLARLELASRWNRPHGGPIAYEFAQVLKAHAHRSEGRIVGT